MSNSSLNDGDSFPVKKMSNSSLNGRDSFAVKKMNDSSVNYGDSFPVKTTKKIQESDDVVIESERFITNDD